jgi:LCP family protein required for cell wall assembly
VVSSLQFLLGVVLPVTVGAHMLVAWSWWLDVWSSRPAMTLAAVVTVAVLSVAVRWWAVAALRPADAGLFGYAAVMSAAATVALVPALLLWSAAQMTDGVFNGADVRSDELAPVAAPGSLVSAPPTTPQRPSQSTVPDPFVIRPARLADGTRWNVLVVGGDAGPGRWGVRADTMMLLSTDVRSGDMVLFSIPRNLWGLPFPAGSPAAGYWPDGFAGLANAVPTWVAGRADVYPELSRDVAGVQVLADGVAELTGLEVDDWVSVDMAGFVDLIDAAGGVTMWVPEAVPSPGNPPGAKRPVPSRIEAGVQQMDGTLALAYARSRSGDSDYERMRRQRCLVTSFAQTVVGLSSNDLTRLLTSSAGTLQTSLALSEIPDFMGLLPRLEMTEATSVVFAPPVLQPSDWTLEQVRLIVFAAISDPPPPTTGTTIPSAPSTAAPPPTTVPTGGPDQLVTTCLPPL